MSMCVYVAWVCICMPVLVHPQMCVFEREEGANMGSVCSCCIMQQSSESNLTVLQPHDIDMEYRLFKTVALHTNTNMLTIKLGRL